MRLTVGAANLAVASSATPGTWAWWTGIHQLRKTQARIWEKIRNRNAMSDYGRQYRFDAKPTLTDLRHLPIMTGDDLVTLSQHHRSLTSDPILRHIATSGTSGGRKDIPYTASLLAEFQAGLDPWLASLYVRYPSLLAGCAYWQITPVIKEDKLQPNPMSEESSDDTEYLGRSRAAIMRQVMAVPNRVAIASNLETFQWQTIQHLGQRRDLTFISVWNPTFLMLLLDAVPSLIGKFVDHLRTTGDDRRASEVQRIFQGWNGDHQQLDADGRTWPERLWPQLRAVSCWADANAAQPAKVLQDRLPHVTIEPKGLIATEAIVTFPWQRDRHVLAATSHVYEFLPDDRPTDQPRLADELEYGRQYRVIVTTGGGLYRYALGDIVEVTGFVRQCPTLRFIGRHDGVVDLVGEKLSPIEVQTAVNAVLNELGAAVRFWMVAPDRYLTGQHGYTLYLQTDAPLAAKRCSAAIDDRLRQNPHYAYARTLGQLIPIGVFGIDPSANPNSIYVLQRSFSQQLGTIKPPVLDQRTDWSTVFPGMYLHCPRTD